MTIFLPTGLFQEEIKLVDCQVFVDPYEEVDQMVCSLFTSLI